MTQTDTGSKAMVTFTMPNVSLKVSEDSSNTVMQICTLNSFDGTTRFVSKAGGLRTKCLNGQILGNVVSSYSSYHTKSLDVDAAADGIINMIVDFQNAKEYWNAMMQQYVSGDHAGEVFKRFLYLEDHDFDGKPNKRFELCTGLWYAYVREFGSNAYALYNVLTEYVSRSNLSAAGEIRERNHVAKMLDTEAAFREARQAA